MKKYLVTMHAKERAIERLGIQESSAEVHLNQLLNNSTEIYSTSTTSRHWQHKKGVIIVTDLNKETIITVYKQGEAPDNLNLTIVDDEIIKSVEKIFNKRIKMLNSKLLDNEYERTKFEVKLTRIKKAIYKTNDDHKAITLKAEYDELVNLIKANKNINHTITLERNNFINQCSAIIGQDLNKRADVFAKVKEEVH